MTAGQPLSVGDVSPFVSHTRAGKGRCWARRSQTLLVCLEGHAGHLLPGPPRLPSPLAPGCLGAFHRGRDSSAPRLLSLPATRLLISSVSWGSGPPPSLITEQWSFSTVCGWAPQHAWRGRVGPREGGTEPTTGRPDSLRSPPSSPLKPPPCSFTSFGPNLPLGTV